MCAQFAAGVRVFDVGHRLALIPFSDPSTRRFLAGWSAARIGRSFHLVAPSGTVESGRVAVPTLVAVLFPFLSALFRAGPVRAALMSAYDVAQARRDDSACAPVALTFG